MVDLIQGVIDDAEFIFCEFHDQLSLTGVAVEKLHFPRNGKILGDRKCLGKRRSSFVGHPSAVLFLRISQIGVFQQPQAITLINPGHPSIRVMANLVNNGVQP
jgi:hypothetical protein